jgi:hypothetical protein
MPVILFLGANPSMTTRLALDKEVCEISQRLVKAAHRDEIRLVQEWAVRAEDLQEHLLRHRPSVVHFSGHGNSSGQLLVENGAGRAVPLGREAVSRLFHVLRKNIRCVVLNACFSADQASAIAEHIDCVVGMTTAVRDSVAITFAGAFYQGLGFGESVQSAFDLGCNQIDVAALDAARGATLSKIRDLDCDHNDFAALADADVPCLIVRPGIRADGVFLHQAASHGPARP